MPRAKINRVQVPLAALPRNTPELQIAYRIYGVGIESVEVVREIAAYLMNGKHGPKVREEIMSSMGLKTPAEFWEVAEKAMLTYEAEIVRMEAAAKDPLIAQQEETKAMQMAEERRQQWMTAKKHKEAESAVLARGKPGQLSKRKAATNEPDNTDRRIVKRACVNGSAHKNNIMDVNEAATIKVTIDLTVDTIVSEKARNEGVIHHDGPGVAREHGESGNRAESNRRECKDVLVITIDDSDEE